MRFRNLVITGSDAELRRLESEYRMIGYFVKRGQGHITVCTRRPKPAPKKRGKGRFKPSRGEKK